MIAHSIAFAKKRKFSPPCRKNNGLNEGLATQQFSGNESDGTILVLTTDDARYFTKLVLRINCFISFAWRNIFVCVQQFNFFLKRQVSHSV